VELRLPELAGDVEFATVVQWRKQEGDAVTEDDVVLEVDADKANVEISAPASGRLVEILAVEGDEVRVGGVLAIIEVDA
jgi:pyruvate/2-oxoglutarate dehydrogenase complex dihydrolipoamide acyltransferase (E2) component